MAGIIGLRAEDMDQVDALRRARPDFPGGLPMVRPHVRTLILVREKGEVVAKPARFGFSRRFSSINARVEKLSVSPLWRSMFGRNHGIVPISYVIEWIETGEDKQPYLVQRRDGRVILAPALFGPYHENKEELAFAICTREPNRFFAHFHERMVGMCPPPLMERWLGPEDVSKEELAACIAAPADEELEAVPTSDEITKRRAGDWSALPRVGPGLTWETLQGKRASTPKPA